MLVARFVLLALVGLVLSCSVPIHRPNDYSLTVENVAALRTFQGAHVAVGPFDSAVPGAEEFKCRHFSPIAFPRDEPLAEFVRGAFIKELRVAEIYDQASPTTLRGTLTQATFSSTEGVWRLGLLLKSSNGEALEVSRESPFEIGYFWGAYACHVTAQAAVPAVQALIHSVVTSPDFPRLLE